MPNRTAGIKYLPGRCWQSIETRVCVCTCILGWSVCWSTCRKGMNGERRRFGFSVQVLIKPTVKRRTQNAGIKIVYRTRVGTLFDGILYTLMAFRAIKHSRILIKRFGHKSENVNCREAKLFPSSLRVFCLSFRDRLLIVENYSLGNGISWMFG